MKASSLSLIACPHCHQELAFNGEPITESNFFCSSCKQHYPLHDSIALFIEYQGLNGTHKRFAHLYDRVAPFYRPISEIAQWLEDRTLIAELAGYASYTQRTHYRLLPGVW